MGGVFAAWPAFVVDEDAGVCPVDVRLGVDPLETTLAAGFLLAPPSPDAGAFADALEPGVTAAPLTLARRRASAAAASPSDWLEAGGGASTHRMAIDSAVVVRARVPKVGASPLIRSPAPELGLQGRPYTLSQVAISQPQRATTSGY
jgi:hypothetical protein